MTAASRPRLSVVVPFFDIERDFAATLESLRLQSLTDAEFILVDDGSRDSSAQIAREYCARDHRFVLLSQSNAGAGAARNHGAGVARGEYLAFFDCDDVVPYGFFARAVAILDGSGSDLLVASAERFDSVGIYPSVLHALAITRTQTATCIADSPELGLDRMVWNKVIRRSFWDDAGLRFRTIMYEDYPFCLETQIAAARVDVLNEVGCYWRRREGGEQSVTQQTANPAQLSGRFDSDDLVLDLAEAHAPRSLPLIRDHLLEIDVTAFARAVPGLDDSAAAGVIAQAQALLDRIGPDAVAGASGFLRVQAGLLRAADSDGLARLHAHVDRFGPRGRVRRSGDGFVEDFALGPGITAVPCGPPALSAGLELARWEDDGTLTVVIAMESTAALSVDLPARVLLEPAAADAAPIELACTARSRHGAFGAEDGLELTVNLDPAVLVAESRLNRSFWRFVVDLAPLGEPARTPVRVISRSRGRVLEPRPVPGPPGTCVQVGNQVGTGFGLSVQRPVVVITTSEAVGDRLRLAGTIRPAALPADADQTAQLVLVGPGETVLDLPVRVTREGAGLGFVVEVPCAELATGAGHWSPVPAQTTWRVRMHLNGTARAVFVGAGVPAVVSVVGEQLVRAHRGPAGAVALVVGRNDPEVTAVAWTSPTTLRFDGVWRGRLPLPAEVRVRHPAHAPGPDALRVPLHAGAGTYWFEVDAEELVRRGPEQPSGPNPEPWHLVLDFPDRPAVQNHDRHRAHEFAGPRVVAGHLVDLRIAGGDVVRLFVG